ncbi:helix-turn-helix domain-containing protein [Nonomuraea sp. NPDC050790]|uniref:helix-turn-helix domain-containing protein n=1 Tax=Nonomuraea sp. NPDC050790 TaxID=3364371 RepID=UPI003787DD3D
MRSAVIDGGKLRETREDRELSGTVLAALLTQELGRNVYPSTIYRLESGKRQPSPKLFGALCRILRCTKADLIVLSTPEGDL